MPEFRKLLTLRIADAFAKAGVTVPEEVVIQAVNASDARFGDYQSNAAMMVAKLVRSNPRQLAQNVADAFDGTGLCEAPTIAGPGFLNFRLTSEVLAEAISTQLG